MLVLHMEISNPPSVLAFGKIKAGWLLNANTLTGMI